jgi:hypothetical protein
LIPSDEIKRLEGNVAHYKAEFLLILAQLFKLARIVPGETHDPKDDSWNISLPRYAWKKVLALLVPAESALRRLIIMGAFGKMFDVEASLLNSVKSVASKPNQPEELSKLSASLPCAKSARPPRFDMFDPLKTFSYISFDTFEEYHAWKAEKDAHPLIIGPADPTKRMDKVKALAIWRRIHAMQHAMDNFDDYVTRYGRWRATRKAILATGKPLDGKHALSLMRRSRPPGYVEKHGDDVHYLLRDVHTIAYDSELPKWQNSS